MVRVRRDSHLCWIGVDWTEESCLQFLLDVPARAYNRAVADRVIDRFLWKPYVLHAGLLAVLAWNGTTGWETWSYYLLLVSLLIIHGTGASGYSQRATFAGMISFCASTLVIVLVPNRWQALWLGAGVAGLALTLIHDQIRTGGLDAGLRQFLEKDLTLASFLETFAELNLDAWIEELGDSRAAVDLRALQRPIEGKGVEALEDIVRGHSDLHVIVERYRREQVLLFERSIRSGRAVKDREVKELEWKVLEERLHAVLARYGMNDAFGEGDFFLVDDQAGECAHKLELQNCSLLTRDLAKDVQAALAGLKHDWSLFVTLHFDKAPLKWYHPWIAIHADRIEECWDVDLLRRHLGERFRW